MAVVVDFSTGKSIGEFQLQKTAETECVFQMSEIEFCCWGVEAAEYINQGDSILSLNILGEGNFTKVKLQLAAVRLYDGILVWKGSRHSARTQQHTNSGKSSKHLEEHYYNCPFNHLRHHKILGIHGVRCELDFINLRYTYKELWERVVKDAEDVSVKQTAQLIYQTALMESGFVLNDPKDFAACVTPDAAVEEEDYLEEVVELEKKQATSSSKAEADEDIEEP